MQPALPSNSPDSLLGGSAGATSAFPLEPQALPWHAVQSIGRIRLPWAQALRIRLARMRRWEFWPSWVYYGPIVLWIVWLGIKHRSFTVFTACDPALDAGGLVGESKHQALQLLQANAPDLAATYIYVPADPAGVKQRTAKALVFAQQHGFPVVLKPDVGLRGRGVYVARSEQQVCDYISRFGGDLIVQRHIAGEEFGVFVARMPGQQQVQVLSIVNKTFPTVTGDGVLNLRQLILADARASLISALLLARWEAELARVVAQGEVVQLVEIGTHSRGSLFLDACHLATPALEATLRRLLDATPGYAFGRMDLRVPSAAHLERGEGLKVLEFNGVSSESAHIYHPDTPLWQGYRAMFVQWSLAFEIGAAYASQGVPVTSARELLRLWREDMRRGTAWF